MEVGRAAMMVLFRPDPAPTPETYPVTRAFLAFATLALLAGCGHGGPAASVSTRAIGCLPGDCPTPRPTVAPCGPLRPKAIGCLPGDCPPKPPKPCR